jgi:hypothetical protein
LHAPVSGHDNEILALLPHDRGLEDAECADIGNELAVGMIAGSCVAGIGGVCFKTAWIEAVQLHDLNLLCG